jgi:hypothetical protein
MERLMRGLGLGFALVGSRIFSVCGQQSRRHFSLGAADSRQLDMISCISSTRALQRPGIGKGILSVKWTGN